MRIIDEVCKNKRRKFMFYFDASLIKFVKADIFHYAIYRNINKQLFIITDYQTPNSNTNRNQ